MKDFTEYVITIIKAIPDGRVMTYGQIAKVAGKPRAARQVSWILHSMSQKYKLPWHRVINSKGEISLKGSEQKELLEMEGVHFSNLGKVNLDTYLWEPDEEELLHG
ncbi:MGMT family protein [Pseudogracilibacillus sp. SO30301A]|uniref:MGMT family protein n=1 Tax=Pseudogracilibacillus sp. SO30301A TaxID=3098291 RepID=UPI00300E21E3